MKELGISPKIRLPEDKAPGSDVQRVAVLKFFDCFAKGKADGLKGILEKSDAQVLASMSANGGFEQLCAPISRIDLVTVPTGGRYKSDMVMAVFRAGGKVQAQLWNYTAQGEGRKVATQKFESYAQPVDVMSKVSGSDLIAAWVKLVLDEQKIAKEPDVDVKPTAKVQEVDKSDGGGGGESVDAPSGPIGAPPMRNREPPGSIPGRQRPGPSNER
jgi:hypothetical protein